ncbi:MAG: hypothetical protein ACOZAM_22350 [Pseudomonadota bacterium]
MPSTARSHIHRESNAGLDRIEFRDYAIGPPKATLQVRMLESDGSRLKAPILFQLKKLYAFAIREIYWLYRAVRPVRWAGQRSMRILKYPVSDFFQGLCDFRRPITGLLTEQEGCEIR